METKAGKTVIVVDGQPNSRNSLVAMLTAGGYRVEACEDARTALESMVLAQFVAVVCDPGTAGIGLQPLLKNVRRKNFPLVITTDNAKDIEVCNDAAVVLPKRPGSAELLDAITVCASDHEAPDAAALTGEGYCRVALGDFLTGRTTSFDIFVRVAAGKYVKVAKTGDELSPERLSSYKSRGARFLYLKQAEFTRYLGLSVALAEKVAGSQTITLEKRLKVVAHASDVILEQLNSNRIDGKSFQAARSVVESSISMLTSTDSGYQLLEMLQSRSDVMYLHYIGVSFYSALVARGLGLTMPPELYKIAVGGLLHDIGAVDSSQMAAVTSAAGIASPAIAGAIAQDKGTHPTRGVKILGEISTMPEEVVRIILEHHEHPSGIGYPKGLGAEEIHPFARLVSIVDEFCHLILKNEHGPGMPVEEAFDKMLQGRVWGADLRYIEMLVSLFKLRIDDKVGLVRPL